MMQDMPIYYPTLYTSDYSKGDNILSTERELNPQKPESCPSNSKGDRWITGLVLCILLHISIILGLAVTPFLFILAIVIYLFGWIEAMWGDTPKFLKNIYQNESAVQLWEELKGVGPNTKWHIVCWHNVKSGNKGGTKRVITVNKEYDIYYKYWTDSSPIVVGIEDNIILTRLYTKTAIAYLDPNIRNRYSNKRTKFIENNKKDKYSSFTEVHDIRGLKLCALTFSRKDKLSPIFQYKWYLGLTALFLFGWIVRLLLYSKSVRVDYKFVKVVHQLNN